MGIKDFTKVFKPTLQVRYAQLPAVLSTEARPIRIAVDAMNQIHRSATWKAASKLTAPPSGGSDEARPTAHIIVSLAMIKKARAAGIEMIWVFDTANRSGDGSLKVEEVQRRRGLKERAKQKLEQLNGPEDGAAIERLKRQMFSVDTTMINEIQFLLDAYGIPWVEAVSDGEALCALLTRCDNPFGLCDAVLSDDTDTLIFGAKALLKRARPASQSKKANKAKKPKFDFELYKLDELLHEHKLTYDDLVKIAVVMGCDYAPKTRLIGPKRVLEKFRDVVLTDRQEAARKYFAVDCNELNARGLQIHRAEPDMGKLAAWLKERGFADKSIAAACAAPVDV